MTALQLGDRTLTADDILPMLTDYRLIPHLLRELIVDRAIATIPCSSEDTERAIASFDRHWGISSDTERETWRLQHGLSPEQFQLHATRHFRIEQFKQATWGRRLESYFLQRKHRLDRVVYSLVRTNNADVAHELFFRIQAGEQSFADVARQYSTGPETQTGGLLGPVEFGQMHPHLAELLSVSPPGEVQEPVRLGEWCVIVRVEKLVPASLNEAMQRRLLNEQFELWFREQLAQLTPTEQRWMGVAPKSPSESDAQPAIASA